jgi:hypothetical protein
MRADLSEPCQLQILGTTCVPEEEEEEKDER